MHPVRPLLLRRPKVVFFGAQAEKNRLFFFIRRRLVMVFGGQITFSIPPKIISVAKFFFGVFFFSALRKTAVFRRPKPKISFFGGRLRSKGLHPVGQTFLLIYPHFGIDFLHPTPYAPDNLVSRETGSAVSSRVSLLILHTQAESGAYSKNPCRFPRGVYVDEFKLWNLKAENRGTS